jgi:hypothetical protein
MGLVGTGALAQQAGSPTPPPVPAEGPNPLVSLASEFFEHDYVNIYAFGDGVLDTNNPILTNTGTVRNSIGTGFDIGGGISLNHGFKDAQLGLNYQGAYRDYQSSYYTSGTSQLLSLGYTKRLSRHMSMNIGASGGIFLYGGTFFTGQPAANTVVLTSPFSPETKSAGASIGFTYQQTRRLSYSVVGSFFLSRYNYPGSIGSTGVGGTAAVNYRLTVRTTLSAIYSHSYFSYQHNAGQENADQIGLSLAHAFSNHWNASVFVGGTRSVATGTVQVPVTLLIGNQAVGGYIIGKYNQTAYVPSFSGTLSHSYRRSLFSVGAGEGIFGSGNGYLLASRSIYFNGIFSYSWHAQNISFGGGYNRLSSVANSVSAQYTGVGFSASYGRNLIRYVGMFVRYDFTHYGALQPYGGVSDNRISFGFNFSSKSVPMTLF